MPLFEFVWLASFERSARPCERVYLILAYAKGDQETVTKDEERTLRRLARMLTQEPC